jgi:hypothetical protein
MLVMPTVDHPLNPFSNPPFTRTPALAGCARHPAIRKIAIEYLMAMTLVSDEVQRLED